MSEGAVHLERDVEVLVAEGDVRAECHLRHCLSCYIAVGTVLDVDDTVVVQVFNLIVTGTRIVLSDSDSLAMRQVEHAKWLTDNLIDDFVITSVEPCAVESADGRDAVGRHVRPVEVAAQRKQLVALP